MIIYLVVLFLLRCKKSNLGSDSVLGRLVLIVAQERQAEVDNPLVHAMYDGVAGCREER